METTKIDEITRKIKVMLVDEECTCVLSNGESIIKSKIRGVKPLLNIIDSNIPQMLSAADKVVGKATAFLYVLLRVKKIYAGVISKPALEILIEHNIQCMYEELVDNIMNRQGTDICPFEKLVINVSHVNEAYNLIESQIKNN